MFKTSSKKRLSVDKVYSISKARIQSLNKIQSGDLRINKNMFVPNTIKASPQLHRKLELRKERIKTQFSK